MVINRGGVFWADLGPIVGSRPAKRRPVLVIQSDRYNESRLATVLVAVLTSNTELATFPGNTFVPAVASGLPRDSVVNVSALASINKSDLGEHVGYVPGYLIEKVDQGLRRILGL